MNKIIRRKVIGVNLIKLLLGIALIVIGVGGTIAAFEEGSIYFILIGLPGVGFFIFIRALFKMIIPSSNGVYKCYKYYGEDESIIEEIQKAINNPDKDFESNLLIVSNGWIIKPKDFIFVKPEDVNWFYLSKEDKWGNPVQKIKIFTTFGLEFEIICNYFNRYGENSWALVNQFSITCLAVLKHLCKDAILAYTPMMRSIWSQNPKDFIVRLKEEQEILKNTYIS